MNRSKNTNQSIFLTGFEPFLVNGTLVGNPTAGLVEALSTRVDYSVTLPVEYDRTRRLFDDYLSQYTPSVWVGLGLASARTAIALEAIALNVQHSDGADNAGIYRHNTQIISGGPAAYQTQLPLAELVATLRQHHVEAHVSYHAGTFLCNQVYYQAARWAAFSDTPLHTALFIHIPPEQCLPKPLALTALHTLLDWLEMR